jgi:hypothetical protein
VKRELPLDQAHEAFALVTLLCRRAGLLGVTPAAAHALVRALHLSLRSAAPALAAELVTRIEVVSFEGYCSGRDERIANAHRAQLRRSQVLEVLAPHCVLGVFSGEQSPASLSLLLDELGRLALHHEAPVCLIDVTRLVLSDEDVQRALFDGLATLSSLGMRPLVVASGEAWQRACVRFAQVTADCVLLPSFASAVQEALAEAGHELKPKRRWPRDLFSRGR